MLYLKKVNFKFCLFVLILFIFSQSFSQMSNGSYKFKNADVTLSFTVENGGWDISNVVLIYNANGHKEYGSGEWFKVNRNGADPDYSGQDGWYQFQTSKCNYSFDEPTSKLVLKQYDCVVNRREMTYTLTRAK